MRPFGKYRLLEPLASGGMADVWRAEVTGAEGVVKEVALKLVRGEHAARGDFVRMFVQEARLAARLTHANVVQVFEFDQVGGRYYLAMELVRGRHLGQVVERARQAGVRFGLARAVHVAAEVAKGLAYAHRLSDGGRPVGLVHRDVSPHNVLLSFEGEVKLADFGIARAMNQGELTDPGTVKGKLAYMAPEQARGGAVDARADVFSLGVVLWELCAGRRLLARDTDAATLAAVLSDEPFTPPSAWNEEIPAELDAAVLAALERDPGKRTRSAQDLAAALAAVLLRVTRAPEDVDLRAFLQRLFPREAALAATGATAQEATAVRPVPVAAESAAPWPAPLAHGAEHGAAPPTAASPSSGPPAGDGPPADAETRTAPAPARLRRRGAALALGAGAVAAAALAGMAAARRAPPAASPAPAAAEASLAVPASAALAQELAPVGGDRIAGARPAPADGSSAVAQSPPPAIAPAAARGPAEPPSAGPSSTAARAEPRDAGAEPAPAPPRRPARLEVVHALGQLPVPPAASGEGILSVNPSPWGRVTLDGAPLGDSPLEVRLPAGRHRLRVDVRGQRGVERTVTIEPGRRTTFRR